MKSIQVRYDSGGVSEHNWPAAPLLRCISSSQHPMADEARLQHTFLPKERRSFCALDHMHTLYYGNSERKFVSGASDMQHHLTNGLSRRCVRGSAKRDYGSVARHAAQRVIKRNGFWSCLRGLRWKLSAR